MNDIELKKSIREAVTQFANRSLRDAALAMFTKLGYQSDRTVSVDSVADFCEQFDPEGKLEHPKAMKSSWHKAELLFQLTDEELSSNASLFKETNVRASLLQSYVFLAVELKSGDYARGKLAAIARQINRIFPMPVMVLFKVADKMSLAVINRRLHKRDESKDVLGKVTLIQNIDVNAPHPGHIDILASFSTIELIARKKPINNFDQLHAAWEDVFNVELLNKRFYEELSNWYFWARPQVEFPADMEPDDHTRNATSVIRLLTRLIFCWFLKEKDLIPQNLFDADAVGDLLNTTDAENSSYYQAVLQNLFFATLNQPMNAGNQTHRQFAAEGSFQEQRTQHGVKTLYRYQNAFKQPASALSLFENIPFLNGGLFACLDIEDDSGKVKYADGFSRNIKKQAYVPNKLFFAEPHQVDLSGKDAFNDTKKKKATVRGLIHILNGYKFTIAESTPVEQEIALDPELLGNVFENLLASYNPETGESARRQTGSFYTPRPIVDHMVDEALKAYLADALCQRLPKTSKDDAKAGLDILFAYTEKEHAFTAKECDALIAAIDACNILDPACGSGAYPMGILHKLVFILGKLDPNNQKWRQRQIDKAEKIEDAEARDSAIRAIDNDFANNALDYGRKLYLIENCIYGSDIQPIAIQIAKLRFFISLICDQKTNTDKSRNLGIRPLPNLETRFVAANSLLGLNLPKNRSLFENPEVTQLEKDLETVRHRYFSAQTRQAKRDLQKRDRELTQKIIKLLKADDFGSEDVYRRIAWNPYDHHNVADFFDPGKMFGPELEHGFDVVIGNPPYVQIQKYPVDVKQAWLAQGFKTYSSAADIYCLFYERGMRLLKEGGQLSYITSNRWMRAGYGESLRSFLAKDVDTVSVMDFGMAQNFGAATTYTCIVHAINRPPTNQTRACYVTDDIAAVRNPVVYFSHHAVRRSDMSSEPWVLLSADRYRIKKQVEAQGEPLEKWRIQINRGLLTGYNEAFYVNSVQRDAFVSEDPRCADLVVPLLRGRDVQRYFTDWPVLDDEKWMINSHNGVKERGLKPLNVQQDYPVLWRHLQQHRDKLEPRADQGDHWSNLRNCAYLDEFKKPKIIYPEITKYLGFYLDSRGAFYPNNKAFIITSDDVSLPHLVAVLNSTLFRCCFRDNFPELMGNSYEVRKIFVDKIPIKKPTVEQASLFEALVPMVQAAKASVQQTPDTRLQNAANFLEQVMDVCVMELYFFQHMSERKLGITAEVTKLIKPVTGQEKSDELTNALLDFYAQANDSSHPIRNILLRVPLDSPDLLAVIQREGAV
jgi:adenine-specific DNA-methyltransferase